MRSGTIAFLLGIITLHFFSSIPAPVWYLIITIAILALIFLRAYLAKQHRLWPQLLIAFLLGFVWVSWYAHLNLQDTLPKSLEGKGLLAYGRINSVPTSYKRYSNFIFTIKKINYKDKVIHKKINVRLAWYGKQPTLHVGDEWRLCIRLKRPHGFANPGGFDFSAWVLQHNMGAAGYVRMHASNRLLKTSIWSEPINQIRQYLNKSIDQQLQGQKFTGIVKALTIGIRNEITQEQWQVLTRTGTNHLMAISGLHIGLIAGFMFVLVSFLWRMSAALCQYMATPHAAALGAILAAIVYSALAGFAIPTQRALVMIAVFMFTLLLRRNIASWSAFCLALLIVLLINPLATLSAGFWLSFAAVAVIVYGMGQRGTSKKLWWRWGRAQWLVTIGLMPLTLLFFQRASLVSLLANFIAIPWVGFLVVPVCLVGSLLTLIGPSWGTGFLLLGEWLLKLLWPILTYLASHSFSVWQLAMPNRWVLLMALVAVLLLLAPKGLLGRWFAIVWLLPLLFYSPPRPKQGSVWFTLLDVGQGLAAVIQTHKRTLLYDTGAKFNDNFNMGSAVVLPYLNHLGIKKVDMMVISHPDNDHIGGAFYLLKHMVIKQISTSDLTKFKDLSIPIVHCERGQAWQWDGVRFRFLYPPAHYLGLNNDSSCVLRITAADQSILLPGDIEKFAENYLIKHEADQLPAVILVAPHHGSRTSSIHAFVSAVKPRYVLFAVGYRNRYRFPHKVITHRYNGLSAVMLRSDRSGAITFRLTQGGKLIGPGEYRSTHARYWYGDDSNDSNDN